MNYLKIYDALVCKSKIRGLDKNKLEGYYEKHHVIPKCMGGSDSDDNFVLFTPREHVIAHKLLWKAYPDNIKLMWAYSRTVNSHKKILTSREVEKLKLIKAKTMSERVISEETKKKISDTLKGHKRSRESVEKGSAKLRGRKASPERIEAQRVKRLELIASGWTHSEESRAKISASSRGRIPSEETRKKISLAFKGRSISDNTRKAASEYQKSLLPWERSSAKSNPNKLERWRWADYYFEFWEFVGKPKHCSFTSYLNSAQGTSYYQGYFQCMVGMFTSGWVPMEDPKWRLNFCE